MAVRDSLLKSLSTIKEDKVGLLLSGGNGSASVLFALLELNKEVHAYTFHMENHESTDLKRARAITSKYGVRLTEVPLPSDLRTLKRDCLYLVNEVGCVLKTDVECSFPIKYVLPLVEEKVLTSGLGDDNYFALSKQGQIHYRHSVESMNAYREKAFREYEVQVNLFQKMADNYGISLVSPYQMQDMIDTFKDTSWEEINKPKIKQWILNSYPKEFEGIKFYHANFQKGDSKISDNFLQLLSSDWNTKGYKRTDGIFNSIRRGEILE